MSNSSRFHYLSLVQIHNVCTNFISTGRSNYAPRNYRPSTLRRGTLLDDPLSPHHSCHIDYSGHDIRLRSQSAMPGCQRASTASPGHPFNRPMTTNLPARHSNAQTPESQIKSAGSRRRRSEDKENITVPNVVVTIQAEEGRCRSLRYRRQPWHTFI